MKLFDARRETFEEFDARRQAARERLERMHTARTLARRLRALCERPRLNLAWLRRRSLYWGMLPEEFDQVLQGQRLTSSAGYNALHLALHDYQRPALDLNGHVGDVEIVTINEEEQEKLWLREGKKLLKSVRAMVRPGVSKSRTAASKAQRTSATS